MWMLAGVVVGGLFQYLLDAKAYSGLVVIGRGDHVEVKSATGPASDSARGEKLRAVVLHRGRKGKEERRELRTPEDLEAVVAASQVGDMLWFEGGQADEIELKPLTLGMTHDSQRAEWVAPFKFLGDIFMALLKMLIVPLVLTSIISGVAGVGQLTDLKRMGLKTFAYYLATSLFAILIGQTLVNIVQPGDGAELGLKPSDKFGEATDKSLWDVLLRMVPENLFF